MASLPRASRPRPRTRPPSRRSMTGIAPTASSRPSWQARPPAAPGPRLTTEMPITPFKPHFMKVGVLTAALQELTPREVRDPDPDRAIEDWVGFGREIGADYLQLSAALHPSESDVPPEAMLDPVANTLDLRRPFDKDRAK